VTDAENAKPALRPAREARGLHYESSFNGTTVITRSNYEVAQAKRIVRAFVVRVGKKMGEI
jgi:prophage tail gpP-like protein